MLLLLLACQPATDATDKPQDTATTDTADSGADSGDSGDSGADSGDSGADSGDSGADSGDSGTDATFDATDITATVSEHVHTVVTVTWRTEAAAAGYVEFGEAADAGAYPRRTPLQAEGTEHSVLLLGNPADTDLAFRVVTIEADGSERRSDEQLVTTLSLPAELPELTVSGEVESWNGQYLVLPLQGTAFIVAILDDQGRYVWYDVLEPGYNLMRAVLSHDGTAMLYCKAGPQNDLSIGLIERVSMDGSERSSMPFPYIDHDFVELPDGTYAGIVVAGASGYPNAADQIIEQSADGTQRVVWDAWEDPVLWPYYNPGIHNWTHANALDYDAATDAYYVSTKEIGTIIKVDRATGQGEWYLNGDANQFSFSEGSEQGQVQHQMQLVDDGILIFDNGEQSRGYSRAVQFDLDYDALTADEVWSYRHTPDLHINAKGDVERYADGNTRVVWSMAGEIQDVDPDGNVLWQVNTELGYAMTFVTRVESLYAPE